MVDRVQPLKLEDPTTGGTQTDSFPTALDHNEDFVDVRGVALQSATSDDSAVRIERDNADRMVFSDGNNPLGLTLDDLAASGSGISEATHQALRQLIHFIDDGPANGFASGAYREIVGGFFPTAIIWWESAAKAKKIVEKLITRSGGGATFWKPTPIVWKVYDTDGITVLATVTDAITYSGPFEVARTRTIA